MNKKQIISQIESLTSDMSMDELHQIIHDCFSRDELQKMLDHLNIIKDIDNESELTYEQD